MTWWCRQFDSLGGRDLQTDAYTTAAQEGQVRVQTAQRAPLMGKRSDRGPVYTGQEISERQIVVVHALVGDNTDHEASLAQLKQDHYSTTFGPRTLVYTDTDGVAKRTTVVAARLLPLESLETGAVTAEWILMDPVDYSDEADEVEAVELTASPGTVSVTNDGTEYTDAATITITPTALKAAADGQGYVWPVTPVNRNPWPLRRWPVEITDAIGGTGWNHAGEVAAGRSASGGALGNDVEVLINGIRTNVWTWGSGSRTWNSTTTALWANIDMPAARWWTYRGASSLGAGATSVPVRFADGEMVAMPKTPFYATFVNGAGTTAEVVRVTDFDDDLGTLTVVRAQRETSAATWAADSRLYWCPVLLDILHGWTSAPTPAYRNDDFKPMLLATTPADLSTNASWVFERFMETEVAGHLRRRKARSASWFPRLLTDKFDREDMYWGVVPWTAGLGSDAAVATALSIGIRKQHPVVNHPYADTWELPLQVGSTEIRFHESTTTIDMDDREAQLTITAIGRDGTEEQLHVYDATDGDRSLAPTSTAYAYRFRFDPFDPKRDSNTVAIRAANPFDDVSYAEDDGFEVTAVEVDFEDSEKPLFVVGARLEAYQLGRPGAPATLSNGDGETLEFHGLVLTMGDALTLDLEAQTATVGDGSGRAHLLRGTWFRLPPGTANLTFVEAGIGSVEIALPSLRSAWI